MKNKKRTKEIIYLVTNTEHELESGMSRHISGPNCQSLVNAYQGVTGIAVTQSSISVRIKLSKNIFRADRSLRFVETASNTPPLPINPTNSKAP